MCFTVAMMLTTVITISSLASLLVVCQSQEVTPLEAPVCPDCYEGLCNKDEYIQHRSHVLMTLYPGLFRQKHELNLEDCPLLGIPVLGSKQAELHFDCPGAGAGGCTSESHTPVWDQCCVTCEYHSVPWCVTPTNGPDVYVVQLLDVDGGQYQAYPKGYCGEKRSCTGTCEPYQVAQSFLVASQPVYNTTQLQQTDYWFTRVMVDGFCMCSTAVGTSGGNEQISPFYNLIMLISGCIIMLH